MDNVRLFSIMVGKWRVEPGWTILSGRKGRPRRVEGIAVVKNVKVFLKSCFRYSLVVVRSKSDEPCMLRVHLSTRGDLDVEGTSKSSVEP